MNKKILKIIGATLLVAYLVISGFLWSTGNPPKVYKDVIVVVCDSSTSHFVEAAEIESSLKPDSINPVGKRESEYDTHRLQQYLLRNSLIQTAYCYSTPDSSLRIDIYQRHPILRIKSELLRRDVYVDTEGKLMNYKYCRNAVDVPLATGYIDSLRAQGDLYVLAKFLQKNEFWNNAITQIYVERNGDIRLIPRVGSHTILLGSAEDLSGKFDRLLLFYRKVLNKHGWNLYSTINLKFDKQVVAEKKK